MSSRQVGVERPQKHLGRQRRLGAEADDLAQGVNAGVGPPAGQHADSLAGHFGDGVFQRFLNGRLVGLDLPAGVGRAVVGDGEFEGAHCRNNTRLRNGGIAKPQAARMPLSNP